MEGQQATVGAALAALDDAVVYVADASGRITHAGGATAALIGYSAEERVGQLAASCLHEEDAAAFAAAFASAASDPSGVAYHLQGRAYTRDRQVRWFDFTIRSALDNPAIRGVVVRAREVTCDRDVEAQHLQRGERLDALQAAIFNSGLGFWDVDVAADRMRWLNDWPHEHGLPACDGDGHIAKLLAVLDPAHHERVRSAYRAHVAGRTPRFDCEYRVRALDGTWRWVAMRARIVERDAERRPLRMIGTAFDIDRRKRLEEALERRRLQFDAIAANVSAWIVLTDPALRIEYVNRPVFGVAPEQLVGRPVEDCIGADAAAIFARHHRVAIDTGRPVRFTGTLDLGRRVLECQLAPVIVGGVVVGVASTVTEVTERLALERAVLEISGREQRRFASDLHDGLGQELTGIALNLRGLLRQAENLRSPLVPGLAEILGYANGTISTAREIARGASPFAREQGGLRRAIEDLGARMSVDGGPSVSAEVDESVPQDVDPLVAEHLYRVAQEAVANAVRHSGAAGIRVTLDVDPGGAWLRLTVLDDGCGIGTSADAATGLGLKLMRYRAEQIGGTLRIRPGPVGGTRIDCTCPLRTPDELAAASGSGFTPSR